MDHNYESITMPSTITEDERIQELLRWRPPLGLKEKFPYSFVGFDKDLSPVLLVNFGRWDIRSLLEYGGSLVDDFDKYIEAMFRRMVLQSGQQFTSSTGGVNMTNKWVIIMDLSGYSHRQMMSVQTVQKVLSITKLGSAILEDSVKNGHLVNSTLVFQTIWKLIRPILGRAGNCQVHGTNEDKWQQILLQNIDQDQLPVFLGGQSKENLRRPSVLTI